MPMLSNFAGKNEFVFQAVIMFCICVLAFSSRLFSILRHESVIHEFDPWFNFRTTKFLVKEGFYEFHNWFDDKSWYPFGRFIGGTIYPGLMWTAALLYKLLHYLNLPIDIRNVCVLLAPFMASNTCIVVYLMTKQAWTSAAGLMAAAFMALAPGYISRSVAGSYDNEAVAIFAMVLTFYLWLKSIRSGSMLYGAACALAYFYMVASWGGYIFLVNIMPVHTLGVLLAGKYSHRLYIAYCTWYIIGTLLSMQVLFVGFQPVTSPEHFGAFAVFGLLQLHNVFVYIRERVSAAQFHSLTKAVAVTVIAIAGFILFLALTGTVPFLTGRLKSLVGATSNIAIIKSVSEHQPTKWLTFFLDLHVMVALAPIGLYYCFWSLSDVNLFLVFYMLFSGYFASIMIRLMLVISPIACALGGIGASETLLTFAHAMTVTDKSDTDEIDSVNTKKKSKKKKDASTRGIKSPPIAKSSSARPVDASQEEIRDWFRATKVKSVSPLASWTIIAALGMTIFFFVPHCTWMTANMYSSPQVVLSARTVDGSFMIFDDFRESYQWLRHNTAEDAKILSWWDYGYQITGMANRTVIVDNNTRNNTHIATVGLVMASNEERAIQIIRQLDVKYLLVVFGGMIGFSSDDINKFLWMVRISSGIFPEVVERDYMNSAGQYRVDKTISDRLKNSLMYKMSYFNFGNVATEYGKPLGYDRVRHHEIGHKDISFRYLEEAFTSEHWMVRIFRVKDPENLPL